MRLNANEVITVVIYAWILGPVVMLALAGWLDGHFRIPCRKLLLGVIPMFFLGLCAYGQSQGWAQQMEHRVDKIEGWIEGNRDIIANQQTLIKQQGDALTELKGIALQAKEQATQNRESIAIVRNTGETIIGTFKFLYVILAIIGALLGLLQYMTFKSIRVLKNGHNGGIEK